MSKLKSWREIPIGGLLLEERSSREYKTGDWRVFKPVVDKQKCIGCFICWIYCPEPSIIREDSKVEIDYEYCKGCGICEEECPVKAITMVEG
jgi:pyruvate ferredoxin oxidoreductase delta subunit